MPGRFWLMWGWIDPKKRPAPRLVVKSHGVYSETNYNLLLDADPLRESRPADFELGQLLIALGSTLPHGPGRLLEEGCLSALCDRCRKESSSPCRLFVKPWPHGWTREVPFPGGPRSLMQKEPGECLILAKLASMMETPLEQRFHGLYSASAFRRAQGSASQVLEKAVANPSAAGLPTDVGSEEWTQLLWRDLVATLTVPALLPQVVLNLVRSADVPSDRPDLHFFEGNVGRVDFVFVHKGERHVVEIDDPTHRADRQAHADSKRVDRILRHQGWHVHRFGHPEVREAEDFEGFAWELGFPGRLYGRLKDSPEVPPDDLV